MLAVLHALFTGIWFALPATGANHELPARFADGRVFVEPATADGKPLRLYTDTGGGTNLLCRDAAARLALETTAQPDDEELGGVALTHFPKFQPARRIPANLDGNDTLIVYDCKAKAWKDWPVDAFGDGMLSNRWFAGRVWSWDYPNGRLRLESANFQPPKTSQQISLGFRQGGDGRRAFNMPRLVVSIDAAPLDMLLDTGASTTLDPAASATLEDSLPRLRAASFIVRSRLEQWHRAHPDWRFVERAEAGSNLRMIEVPEMQIAGFRVGPVWFTERPDEAFHKWMAQMMDKPTEGAIGGNVFRHFRMTVDYPRAVAYFECTFDCKSTQQSAP